jgi:5-methylcytosine-specific restriction enzyme A
MRVQDNLTEALIEGFKRAGQETGHWAYRYLRSLQQNGGLPTAKRMLGPRSPGQRAGLDRMLDAGRADLTMEAIILRPGFRRLFSASERRVARDRLRQNKKEAAKRMAQRERLYPEELEPGQEYIEGARKHIQVNAHERNRRARLACLKHHGYRCSVCRLLFEKRYGKLGKDFIHVHHLKPVELTNGSYRLDPVADLRPVCPNCHAMLHRAKRILSIKELKAVISRLK